MMEGLTLKEGDDWQNYGIMSGLHLLNRVNFCVLSLGWKISDGNNEMTAGNCTTAFCEDNLSFRVKKI